jgi:hypothetical protein
LTSFGGRQLMGKPIKEITMLKYKSDEISVNLVAKIDDKGDLVLDGYDIGKRVEKHWGDSDYEYTLVVKADYKDTVLLWLIKERFANDSEFRAWLREKDIPNDFSSWI